MQKVYDCTIINFVMKSRQMSDSILIALLITLSGGLQDAYTYFGRDHVFANAQTGNIVLLGAHMLDGNIQAMLRYLMPVLCFACGVFIAEQIQARYRNSRHIHWRQMILLIEIISLTLSAFLPREMNSAANSLVSFSCAMQVQSFRKADGYPYASTMCIGNLRSGMDAFSRWIRTKDPQALNGFLHYLLVISVFLIGAVTGYGLIPHFGIYTILVSSALLSIAGLFLFAEGNI